MKKNIYTKEEIERRASIASLLGLPMETEQDKENADRAVTIAMAWSRIKNAGKKHLLFMEILETVCNQTLSPDVPCPGMNNPTPKVGDTPVLSKYTYSFMLKDVNGNRVGNWRKYSVIARSEEEAREKINAIFPPDPYPVRLHSVNPIP